jgi:hypothetical protein
MLGTWDRVTFSVGVHPCVLLTVQGGREFWILDFGFRIGDKMARTWGSFRFFAGGACAILDDSRGGVPCVWSLESREVRDGWERNWIVMVWSSSVTSYIYTAICCTRRCSYPFTTACFRRRFVAGGLYPIAYSRRALADSQEALPAPTFGTASPSRDAYVATHHRHVLGLGVRCVGAWPSPV